MDKLTIILTNRYVRYGILSFFIGVLLFMVLTIIDMVLTDFVLPIGLRLLLSVLASGYVVYRYLLPKLG
jgi:hypothetical protein